MPTCRKCGVTFPNFDYVQGKVRNLQRRVYCLDCSPFGRHNTRPLPGDLNGQHCKVCGIALSGPRTTYCEKCGEVYKHGYPTMKRRRKDRKAKLIEMMDGKCQVCGYNKCPAALAFHHVGEKRFTLSSSDLSHHTWEDILEEAKHCILLCMNCHAEHHHPDHALEWK
jgi:predicted nucleic acid-binding Zn ribbon protein